MLRRLTSGESIPPSRFPHHKAITAGVATRKLLATIDRIADVFWQTEKANGMGVSTLPPDPAGGAHDP